MARFSADTRQAAWLGFSVWTLSCGLFVLPTWLGAGALPARFLEHVAVLYVVGIALTTLVHLAAVRVRQRAIATKLVAMFLAVAAAAVVLGVADFLASWWLRLAPGDDPFALVAKTLNNIVGYFWLYGLIAAILVVIQVNRTVRERERELADARAAEIEARALAAKAEAAASAARLAALRYQLNPHLLFNALNAASSLVVTHRNEQAEALLAKLSAFLRQTLVTDPQGTVTIGQELATIETYLDVEAVRFGERLRVALDCPPELEDCLVPGFILQPLVENAVKYAMAPTRDTVTLRITVAREHDDLVITVEDDGDPAKVADVRPGTGVGLANVRQRLEVLYGARGTLRAQPLPHGFRASVRLPLATQPTTLRAEAG
ncbi:sensor histidine kinase [Agrilutibacter solisilvae]|uniref:Histidine kinase n=1 Tax=Agrilutibacter solisilvae TaxID=2763317 RepID=A0A975ASW9_9GAMM|nr:histidine kinase [Lysobacter solisilvae]QSX78698.1 histidine kinase [Lysobacter solisilvae]